VIEAELLERFSPAELRAIATRALAEGDDYSRRLLREQLEDEQFERPTKQTDPEVWPRGK
jgi:hypothetical protein